ncbi:MAG TPA: tRNA uridine-5-carboxymethylaminomethyl(34) synthesis GTPase MnmE [Chitinophagaceae bacterium]|nr:tRNA uridine-5-carboxymethylaminomethyl(34) synthesis GTPase MnmE [Chitinophagaceae bacterium]
MMNKLSGWDDTIVAMATPPGIGAIGVIRLSGNNAIDIINKLFPSKDLSIQSSHTLHVGYLKDEDKVLDESVISIYKNPTSYTGEDVVEISCHGSAFIQQQLVQSIINKGARLAKAGEFTQRAFLNGKLDITQAEAVADIIASNTEASKNAALNNMRGGFSEVLKDLREQLIQFSSLIELELDFSEEDVEFGDRKKFVDLIAQISTSTKKLLDSFKLGNVVKNGVSVAIVGKPNAGKSTLLNTLLNDDRAIVSEIAGTTRDTIEEIININGILFRLIDTAGIREHTTDVIENMGVIKSLEKIKEADIVLYLFDVNTIGKDELQIIKENLSDPDSYQDKQLILVGNKSDIIKAGKIKNNYDDLQVQFISAKENTGIEELKNNLFLSVTENNILTENIIVTNSRHYEALQKVEESLNDIKEGLENNISGDLLALDIRHCLHYLGEITGEITNEDRLDYIFSKFCIGK